MKYISSRLFIVLLFCLMFISETNRQNVNEWAQTDQETALRKRVELFYKYFTDGEIEKMLDFACKENKKNIDGPQTEESRKRVEEATKFLQFLSSQNPKVSIKNIKIENQRAVVTVTISFWSEIKQGRHDETMNNVWVFEDNDWFFKSQVEE